MASKKNNKTIIVTGDSRGLGKQTRLLLESKGYDVIGISRNSSDIKFDFKNVEGIKELYFDELKKRGPIHGFVNNAAYAYDDILSNVKENELIKMYNINVLSPILLSKYIIRDMLLNKVKGSLVHISSISTLTGYKGLSMYASTKGAIESFSKNVAREWGRIGIRSNSVSPGFMRTDMSSSLDSESMKKIFQRNAMLKELEIKDVSNVIEFLLNDKSNGITGQNIHVNNGTI